MMENTREKVLDMHRSCDKQLSLQLNVVSAWLELGEPNTRTFLYITHQNAAALWVFTQSGNTGILIYSIFKKFPVVF